MKWLIPLCLSAALAGCGTTAFLAKKPQAAPVAYRQLAADYGLAALRPNLLAGATISEIRSTQAPQPSDWYACVKTTTGNDYAVFYENGKVSDFRFAVTIDKCSGMEGYGFLRPGTPKLRYETSDHPVSAQSPGR